MDPWSLHLNTPFCKAASSFFFPDRFPLKKHGSLKKKKISVTESVKLGARSTLPDWPFLFFFLGMSFFFKKDRTILVASNHKLPFKVVVNL